MRNIWSNTSIIDYCWINLFFLVSVLAAHGIKHKRLTWTREQAIWWRRSQITWRSAWLASQILIVHPRNRSSPHKYGVIRMKNSLWIMLDAHMRVDGRVLALLFSHRLQSVFLQIPSVPMNNMRLRECVCVCTRLKTSAKRMLRCVLQFSCIWAVMTCLFECGERGF